MTPEEAIQQLEFDRAMILFDSTTGEEITPEILKALNKDNFFTYVADGVAIEALKEIQQYREIGTVEECREAVEKQKQKKIIIKDWNPTKCPTCNHELSTSLGKGYYKHPTFLERCPNCGQAIRWEESEEE